MEKEKIIYDKAIRDKIPEIIEATGKRATVEVADKQTFNRYLEEKLGEELEEYLKEGHIEELADLVEVIYGLLELNGVTIEEFEAIRIKKAEVRGGFSKRLVLKEVSDREV
ncbi:MAG TPA: phosphoribosyl-ATP pyrophosphohydrolase [Clostridiales bacterium]|nr:phosphoribosyl-ATP pyrophosphohydrolase [Clostridiales bacterium]